MHRIKLIVPLLLFALTSFLSVPSLLEARPGGGQSYRSGGSSYRSSGSSYRSSGSSYHSSGSGGIDPFWGGIIIVIFVGYLFYSYVKEKRKRATVVRDASQQQSISALHAQDPSFDTNAFLERVKTTMSKVNDAWIQGSMASARRLISDGVYVRFQTQLNLLKSQNLRNLMTDWSILSAELLAAESDSLWDTVHVKVEGQARDKDVSTELDAQQAERAVKKAALEKYEEVWSFIRRRGAKSKAGVPAAEGRCPNCGADLPLSDSVRCEHCQAIVNSGEHDFVLAEITQPEEWRLESAGQAIPGLVELQQRDSTVSRQELEDHASVVFWKWIEARSTGNLQKLARFCVDSLDQPETLARLNLDFVSLKQVAVGSSDVKRIFADPDRNRDCVEVSIRWSASFGSGEPVNQVHLFRLSRSQQATSKRGLSSLDCPVCRGPLAESDVIACAYCGETLSGGKHEWALEYVT